VADGPKDEVKRLKEAVDAPNAVAEKIKEEVINAGWKVVEVAVGEEVNSRGSMSAGPKGQASFTVSPPCKRGMKIHPKP
jgi:hypothetical protein